MSKYEIGTNLTNHEQDQHTENGKASMLSLLKHTVYLC
jgi:hypothetical protein